MQIKDTRPETYTKQISCDRCGRLVDRDEVGFHEFGSIDLKAGYGSVFGDGNDVQIDLCQHCLQLTLGRWLRIVEPGHHRHSVERFKHRLDPKRSGEEPSMVADNTLVAPEDMPAQERNTVDAEGPDSLPQGRHAAIPLKASSDFSAPWASQAISTLEQVSADARVVLALIEARGNQGICNLADIGEHPLITNLCRSIHEQLEAATELNEALIRQLIRTKDRLAAAPKTFAIEQLANEVFVSEAEAWSWLHSPHVMLDDLTPLQVAETPSGAERVHEILVAVKYGGAV